MQGLRLTCRRALIVIFRTVFACSAGLEVILVELGHGLRGESRGLGDECGCQSGEEDVEAAFEFGGAVVGGQDRGEAA